MGVEPKVPQLKPIPAVALEEGIKFGVNLAKKITVLDCKGMRLESIDADCKDLVLVQNHAAMLLAAGDLKALRVGEVDQLAVLFRVYHNKNFIQTRHSYLVRAS